MGRVYNFSAGPGVIPLAVLQQAQREFLDWQHHGLSLLEMPFTGDDFKAIFRCAQQNLRTLLKVPDNYRILFMHGGASAQFSLVPLNLLGNHHSADYIETGHWSSRAFAEGQRYCVANVAGSSRCSHFSRVPGQQELQVFPGSAYCHYTSNETADGVQFDYVPDTGEVPLVCDMTSDFLTRPLDVSRFGLIYASSQKNIGPAGFTVVIVREDLLDRTHPATPAIFDYHRQNHADSLLNTPATFAIYLADLVFQWILAQGGLEVMEACSLHRSRQLYQAIDHSDGFYHCAVEHAHRSRVNARFTLADEALTPQFLDQAAAEGMINLKGHSKTGGIRASLYNAMPYEGVARLADFMRAFAAEYAVHV